MTDYNLILPRELPDAATAATNGAIPLDDGSAVVKVTPKKIVDAGRPFATQGQAEAGTDATVAMSPLTTKQAIEAVVPAVVQPYVDLAEAWAESPTAPNPGVPTSKSAKTWADRAEGYADRSELAAEAASRAPSSWSDFQSPPFTGCLDGAIVQFNGVQFIRDRSANITNFSAGPGWSFYGNFTPEHFGAVGDGVADDTVAFQRVGVAMTEGVSKKLTLRSGAHYLVGASCNIYNQSGITVDLNGATVDSRLFAKSSTGWIFRIEAYNQLSSAVGITGASIAPGQKTITVADGSSFAKGDTVIIGGNEPFSGIAGVSGFGPKFKGEFCEVDSVSGNTITFVNPIRDSYSSAYTRNLFRQGMIEDVVIKNGKGVGYGHVQDWTTTANPTGVRLFRIAQCRNARVDGVDFREFSRFAGVFTRCIGAYADNCHFWGVDKSLSTNDSGASSVWYTGIQFEGCDGFGVRNCYGEYLRRIMDFDGFDSGNSPIPRNAIQIGCTLVRCVNGAGSHAGENYTVIGNVFDRCMTGVNSRAKNVRIIGNSGTVQSRAMSFGRLLPQGASNQTEQTVDFGDWFVEGNTIEVVAPNISDYPDAVTVQGGIFKSLVFTNNNIKHPNPWAMGLSFTRCDTLHVDGNKFTSSAPSTTVGVLIQNITGNLAKFPLGSISRNVFSGYTRAPILSEGYGDANNLSKVGTWWNINDVFDVSGNQVLAGPAIMMKLGDFSTGGSAGSGMLTGFHPAFSAVGNVTKNTFGSAAAAIFQPEDRQLVFNIPVGGFNSGALRYKIGTAITNANNSAGNILSGTMVSLLGASADNNLAVCTTEGTFPALSWPNGTTTTSNPVITFAASVATTMRPGMFITVPGAGSGGSDALTRVVAISANGLSVTTSGGIITAVSGVTVSTRQYVLKRPAMEAVT